MVKIRGISIVVVMSLSLAVIRLGANVIQPAGVDAVWLAVNGFNQFLVRSFEDGERTVAEQ